MLAFKKPNKFQLLHIKVSKVTCNMSKKLLPDFAGPKIYEIHNYGQAGCLSNSK